MKSRIASFSVHGALLIWGAALLGGSVSAELLRLPEIAESALRPEPSFAAASEIKDPALLAIQTQIDSGDLDGAAGMLSEKTGYWRWELSQPAEMQAVGEGLAAKLLEQGEGGKALRVYSLVGRALGRPVDYLYDLASRLPAEQAAILWPEGPCLYITNFGGPKEPPFAQLREEQGRELLESILEPGEATGAAVLKLGAAKESKGQSWYGLPVPGLVISDKPFGLRFALGAKPPVATRLFAKYWVPGSEAGGELVLGEQATSASGVHHVQSRKENLHLKELIRQRHPKDDTAGTGLLELGLAFAVGEAVDVRIENIQVYLPEDWAASLKNALPASVIHKWDFNDATPGWEAVRDIEGLEVKNGLMQLRTTSNEALLRSPAININADYVNCIEIRMKLLEEPEGAKGAFYWSFADYDPKVNGGLPFGEPRTYYFQVQDGWQICRLNLHEGYDVDWWGKRSMLALNPVRRPGMSVQLDYVALLRLNDHEMRAMSNIAAGRERRGVETRPALYTTNSVEQRCALSLARPSVFRTGLAVVDYPAARADDLVEFQADWLAGGERTTVLRYVLGAGKGPQHAAWKDVSVDLRAFTGQQGELVLSTKWSRDEQREAPPLLAAWGAPTLEIEEETPTTRPNIVLICIDTLRADALGAYGDAKGASPNIDALAARSIVYDNAYSTAPWTWHSVCSYMTSLQVRQFSQPKRAFNLEPELVTLAEQLAGQGYSTAAFSLNGWVSELTGLGQGFDYFHDLVTRQEIRSEENFSGRATESALQWLDHHRDKPFFLYVHYLDPHAAYVPVPWTRGRYAVDATDVNWLARRGRASWAADALSREGKTDMTEKDVTYMRALYDEEVLGVDEHVGRIIDSMGLYGLEDNTIIAIISDHGEEFMEHGYLGHGTQINVEQVHVPMILHVPGAAARRDSGLAGLIDLAPTLLGAAGAPALPQGRGLDLLNTPEEARAQRELLLMELLSFDEFQQYAVVTNEWKFVNWSGPVKRMFPLPTAAGQDVELYSRSADPKERQNLAAERGEVVEQLKAKAEALFQELDSQPVVVKEGSEDMGLTDAQREKLEAMGYLH